MSLTRRTFLGVLGSLAVAPPLLAQKGKRPRGEPRAPRGPEGPAADFSAILGRPTDRAIALSLLAKKATEARVELDGKALDQVHALSPDDPLEIVLGNLKPGGRHEYRVLGRAPGQGAFEPLASGSFQTQRAPGNTFTFTVQGDSHPERIGRMYDPDLYRQTMRNLAADKPDFHLMMGDDFSLDRLVSAGTQSQAAVDEIYRHQRGFLGMMAHSAPLFLLNGNHEQTARRLLDGSPDSFPAMAGRARVRHFPLPAPDSFYSGDAEQVPHVGLLRDYYSWTWGDALFVVLDPYWHAPNGAFGELGGATSDDRVKKRDLWDCTLGDAQYHWLTKVLTESTARWKFVFCHHVLGTGRGGIELARTHEWGGRDARGVNRFAEMRPGWKLPVHDLMAKGGVTIFFQGHDHLYARQELDGVVYQSCPNPADHTHTAFNSDAYRSGDILPNSGHLRLSVKPDSVAVEYVRAYLPATGTNGEIAHRYEIKHAAAAKDGAS